jgi:hypothetical protein
LSIEGQTFFPNNLNNIEFDLNFTSGGTAPDLIVKLLDNDNHIITNLSSSDVGIAEAVLTKVSG